MGRKSEWIKKKRHSLGVAEVSRRWARLAGSRRRMGFEVKRRGMERELGGRTELFQGQMSNGAEN